MTSELRKKLAAESFEEKIRKVGMLIDLIKKAPKLEKQPPHNPTKKIVIGTRSAERKLWRD